MVFVRSGRRPWIRRYGCDPCYLIEEQMGEHGGVIRRCMFCIWEGGENEGKERG